MNFCNLDYSLNARDLCIVLSDNNDHERVYYLTRTVSRTRYCVALRNVSHCSLDKVAIRTLADRMPFTCQFLEFVNKPRDAIFVATKLII